jgi:hypothetical protein
MKKRQKVYLESLLQVTHFAYSGQFIFLLKKLNAEILIYAEYFCNFLINREGNSFFRKYEFLKPS